MHNRIPFFCHDFKLNGPSVAMVEIYNATYLCVEVFIVLIIFFFFFFAVSLAKVYVSLDTSIVSQKNGNEGIK